ncbi:uncharacterized protein K460DRAFT_91517 [Cucurbitaria berberidis CBS 394.84]|uniref:Uncharacterized protein n=1 Tax=Cucurbitaria berberidis CBS 394.84 TaxID=1168544 RepID=A0A9P4GQI3_9PLEO|nr:uncharacterized protein K460DRAFT_91517 [Cucurbitaria berberidis CBS 394.84]KAF1849474.1 hypothetical protein K460DRAFT_91517 [Cucurbitaria berberidis CBS 394.84]
MSSSFFSSSSVAPMPAHIVLLDWSTCVVSSLSVCNHPASFSTTTTTQVQPLHTAACGSLAVYPREADEQPLRAAGISHSLKPAIHLSDLSWLPLFRSYCPLILLGHDGKQSQRMDTTCPLHFRVPTLTALSSSRGPKLITSSPSPSLRQ